MGIAVEFCSHLVHSFTSSTESNKLQRASHALTDMGSSVSDDNNNNNNQEETWNFFFDHFDSIVFFFQVFQENETKFTTIAALNLT